MHSTVNLINAACNIDLKNVRFALQEIKGSNKHLLLQENQRGFNCIQAVAASRFAKKSPDQACLIMDLITNKCKQLLNPELYRRVLTASTVSGFTPMHSAINHKNYRLACLLFDKTAEAFGNSIAGGRFAHYLEIKNKSGYTLYSTYKRNIAPENPKNNTSSPELEKRLFGQDLLSQNYLNWLSYRIRDKPSDHYDSFYI